MISLEFSLEFQYNEIFSANLFHDEEEELKGMLSEKLFVTSCSVT